jgi:aspartate aminotransferase/aminotransferase
MAIEDFISERARLVRESGIRRIFNLASSLKDPINFSIGQPDFEVPESAKQAAIEAIRTGHNGYTVTQGLAELREKIAARIAHFYTEPPETLVTSGLSGGLLLALMVTLNAGDEVIYPDPYFVGYPNLVQWLGGKSVEVSTYPDFQLSPDKIAEAITPKTKILLLNSPNNPTGAVYGSEQIQQVCALAKKHDLLIISDEIYCDLSYDGPAASPLAFAPERTILLRGFSKSYSMTGWRLGYAAGPKAIIQQMGNMQQYTFVCAPSIAQYGGIAALDIDMSAQIESYRRKRDLVADELGDCFEYARPCGGFYFFLKVPERFENSTQFVEAALDRNLLCVPGAVFSRQDSYFRISYATSDEKIRSGCEVLRSLAG